MRMCATGRSSSEAVRHDAVVANLLETRKDEVWILRKSGSKAPEVTKADKARGGRFHRDCLVEQVVAIHNHKQRMQSANN